MRENASKRDSTCFVLALAPDASGRVDKIVVFSIDKRSIIDLL